MRIDYRQILRRFRDIVTGSETTFNVISIETGEMRPEPYTSATTPLAGYVSTYHGVMLVRPIHVKLDVNGTRMNVESLENLERRYEGSAFNLYPEEVETLRELTGQPIVTRAKKPYGSVILKKLSNTKRRA